MQYKKKNRIGNILKELGPEKVDIVLYVDDKAKFIENALAPAKNLHVIITDEAKNEALVVVDDDNLSLAIGRKGLNVKLASRLTKFKIDIKTTSEASKIGINFVD